jgi:hypothetical protein
MLSDAVEYYSRALFALESIEKIIYCRGELNIKYIYSKYIDLGGVAKVADHLNEQGYRLKGTTGNRKYTSSDISMLIEQQNPEGVPEELNKLVKEMFGHRKLYMKWHVRLIETYYKCMI